MDEITKERQRLEELLDRADVPPQQRDALVPVIENLAWQRVKLTEARTEMEGASIVCEYDNGGGQTGTRENPVFKSYATLWRGYLAGLEKIIAVLPKEMQAEVSGVNVLEQVRNLKRVQ